MPRRSNQFQQIIRLIHHQLAESATVTESELFPDRDTGLSREVDIAIRSEVGGCAIVVGVECCDRSRPATVEWVEQMLRKHASLETNKLVLVARAGYTRQALTKAIVNGADALTLEEAREVAWTTIVSRTDKVFVDAVGAISRVYHGQAPDMESRLNSVLPLSTVIRSSDQQFKLTVAEFIDVLLDIPSIRSLVVDALQPETDAGWEVSVPVKLGCRAILADGREIHLDWLTLLVLAKRRTTRVQLERGTFRESQIAYGGACGPLGTMLVTIVEREGRTPSGLMLHRWAGHEEVVSPHEPSGRPPELLLEARRALGAMFDTSREDR